MRGSLTLAQLGKDGSPSTWRSVVDLTPPGGTRKQSVTQFKAFTRREADALHNVRVVDAEKGILKARTHETVGTYLDTWVQNRSSLADTTRLRYETMVAQQLKPTLGSIALDKLGPDDIERAYRKLRKTGGARGGPLSETTIRQAHAILGAALTSAVKKRKLIFNPARMIDCVPQARRIDKPVPSAERIQAFIDAVGAADTGVDFVVPLLLAAGCGLRRGEMLGLSWASIDFDRQKATIRESVYQVGTQVATKSPKSGRTRLVPLPSLVIDALRAHQVRQCEWAAACGESYRNDLGLVNAAPDGKHWAPQAFTDGYKRLAVRLGFPELKSFHLMRHAYATHGDAAGIDPKTLQGILGHATFGFPYDRYVRGSAERRANAAVLIDGVLGRHPVAISKGS